MSFDLIIKGGTVVDGAGLPCAEPTRHQARADHRHRATLGRAQDARRRGPRRHAGHRRRAHPLRPAAHLDPYATSSCFHGVTSVVAGNCGYSIAPCAREDHEWLSGLFARSRACRRACCRGAPVGVGHIPVVPRLPRAAARINAAVYIGPLGRLRRFVMREAPYRTAAPTRARPHARLVRDAMRRGPPVSPPRTHRRTSISFSRPVPARCAPFEEVAALAEAAGEGGAGSIAYLAESAVQGYDARDRARLIALAHRSGLPVIVQGMGFGRGSRERWETRRASSPRRASAVRPSTRCLRTQALHAALQLPARDLALRRRLPLADSPTARRRRLGASATRACARSCAGPSTIPTPTARRARRSPARHDPRLRRPFDERSAGRGQDVAQLARSGAPTRPTSCASWPVADGLEDAVRVEQREPQWVEANANRRRTPH